MHIIRCIFLGLGRSSVRRHPGLRQVRVVAGARVAREGNAGGLAESIDSRDSVTYGRLFLP